MLINVNQVVGVSGQKQQNVDAPGVHLDNGDVYFNK